ncbi:hypothetical protein L1887_38805 [Cichorium endivia]|nr:hypothetical protein L1887_38805 [Cichorium endivia]
MNHQVWKKFWTKNATPNLGTKYYVTPNLYITQRALYEKQPRLASKVECHYWKYDQSTMLRWEEPRMRHMFLKTRDSMKQGNERVRLRRDASHGPEKDIKKELVR